MTIDGNSVMQFSSGDISGLSSERSTLLTALGTANAGGSITPQAYLTNIVEAMLQDLMQARRNADLRNIISYAQSIVNVEGSDKATDITTLGGLVTALSGSIS